ncbi:hypothetical protein Q4543_09490 [Salipiger sp. 1_MG-2023]|uniref:hypothetical protein n=1 Tax=Salipiger sp. 1_MG-2023 TaxID=3062665 RepID=UPI0026E12218|nr:hypothetical protein [Salipiger sp. 1_MG-2023]MDO6585754.1 hypothetical protein [Salipiger sp. 1_MG-2023]
MFAENKLTDDITEIQEFLRAERAKSLSDSEWRFRMRGYGYNLRRTEAGVEVARLPQNQMLGVFQI